MDIPVLKVEQRTEMGKGSARRTRAGGRVPAVCYGRAQQPLPLAIDPDALLDILHGPRGMNSLIRLDGADDRTVFVQEMQRHPVERSLLHVDFLSVDPDATIQRTVPIVLEGRPIGVKLGGLLQVVRRRLKVEARPTDLPDAIHVDVGQMDVGDVIHVADLEMPPGVEPQYDRNFTICAVVAPTVEEEKEPEAEEGAEAAGEEGEAPAPAAEAGAEGEAK
jgi:large subunit ribosomal protein L25